MQFKILDFWLPLCGLVSNLIIKIYLFPSSLEIDPISINYH